MIIYVKTKPGAKKAKIEKKNEDNYEVWVKEAADKGKANEAVLEAISKYFKLPRAQVSLETGHSARTKIIELLV